ncbi:MAG: GGDEF domain-containing protein [Nitratiruptor sp.]|nr:GGDEF domain-containing protein [Nitratiruptor sp.]NPA83073.1 GGDEF domain-containing protein [Campylobacterota bacterium]
MERVCHLLEKLDSDAKLSREDMKTIVQIVRKELNFMIRNGIAMTPENYRRWFAIFCLLVEEGKELNDLEILGLFKEHFDQPYDELQNRTQDRLPLYPKDSLQKLTQIAQTIERKLFEIIQLIDAHEGNLRSHEEQISTSSQGIEDPHMQKSIQKILAELERLHRENALLLNELRKYHADVIRLQSELITAKTEAEIDFLTGLVNRRRFERAILEMIDEYRTRGYPFALILLDVDNFKQINDRYGHPVGDQILKEIAMILKTFLRANTVSARIGGEEFAILVPGASTREGEIIAQRLRKAIANRTFSTPQGEVRVSASFGVTGVRRDDTLDTIFARVDKALYQAKERGKNRVVVIE